MEMEMEMDIHHIHERGIVYKIQTGTETVGRCCRKVGSLAMVTRSQAKLAAKQEPQPTLLEPVRDTLLAAVLRTSPAVNLLIRRLCGPLDGVVSVLARAISLTVTDLFMTLVVPVCAVTVDVRFARQLMILFSIVLYCCNLAKNVLRLPRPHKPGDRARPLSDEEKSFGFPSLHCAASVAMPLLILSAGSPLAAAAASEADLPQLRSRVLLGWAASIGFARLHLGVHSLPDVLGGWLLGFGLWRQFDHLVASGTLDQAVSGGGWLLPAATLALALLLALLFPKGRGLDAQGRPGLTDDTVTESVIVIGCATGALLAAWRDATLPALAAPSLEAVAMLEGAAGGLARASIALIGTLAAKTLFKELTRRAVDAVADLAGGTAAAPRDKRKCDGTTARERVARLLCYVLLAIFLLDPLPELVGRR